MGPTNIALVKLFHADQALRAAQGRLDSASSNVRVLERRVADLAEKHKLAQVQLREQQAKAGELDLDIETRDAHIDRLRTQQQNAKNHKEYQAFLTEISAEKIDKGKIEDEALQVMQEVENAQHQMKGLAEQLAAEQARCEQIRQELGGRLSELQAEVDRLAPLRELAAKDVPAEALDAFDRLSERYEGEAMAAMGKPDRRREEYVCMSCHMSLVADVYNRLHSRDEMALCPNCRRLLYIPDDLTPEMAINKPRERRERPVKTPPAAMTRQMSAADVNRSITPDPDEGEEAPAASSDQP